MANFGIKYAALVGCVMTGFVNFVACGSQFYQVSLKDDSKGRSQEAVEGSDDPSSENFGLHSPGGWTSLPIHFKVGFTMNAEQQKGLVKAMNVWEMAVGKKLFQFDGVQPGVTGDTFKDLYSSLDDSVNGHYFDEDWGKTGKPAVVLATTIWDNDPSNSSKITTADIRYNTDRYTIGNSLTDHSASGKEVVDIQTLAIHELGHLLGLTHMSGQIDPQSIMTPKLYIGEGLSNRHISRGDVLRIQKIYGCASTVCDPDQIIAMIDRADKQVTKQPKSSSVDTAH